MCIRDSGNVSFFIRFERAAPLDAVRKMGAQLNMRGTVFLLSLIHIFADQGGVFVLKQEHQSVRGAGAAQYLQRLHA